MNTARSSAGGFTLIELIVALAVFSVLSVMAYSGLQSVLDARAKTEEHAKRLEALQTLFLWVGKDVEQALPRAVRDPYGEKLAALKGESIQEFKLELTHAGWSNPFPSETRQRSHLQRVAYGLREKQLIRKYWFDLDREYESATFETVMLDGVTAVEFRYVDRNRQWQTQWPALDNPEALPQAVELTVEMEGFGKITRLFHLPEGVTPKKSTT